MAAQEVHRFEGATHSLLAVLRVLESRRELADGLVGCLLVVVYEDCVQLVWKAAMKELGENQVLWFSKLPPIISLRSILYECNYLSIPGKPQLLVIWSWTVHLMVHLHHMSAIGSS